MPKYNVKFFVKAIIEVETSADSSEEAIEAAMERMKERSIFAKGIGHVSGTEEVAGYDNLDLWNEAE